MDLGNHDQAKGEPVLISKHPSFEFIGILWTVRKQYVTAGVKRTARSVRPWHAAAEDLYWSSQQLELLDFRITGLKGVQVEKLTAIIERFGSRAEAMVDKVTAGVSPAKVTAVAMLAEVDKIEIEDSDSEAEEDYEEAQEGRADDEWQEGEGFTSGSMGLTKFKAEKK